MLRTIILDAYKESEKKEIAKALYEICSPKDNYGWASAGIYSYWDYDTKEILYIGLAVDLTKRFKQHNGFYKTIDRNTCKVGEIDNYFKTKSKLGFSIIVQAPLSQPIISLNKKQYKIFESMGIPVEDYSGEEGRDNIKLQEGVLLEAFRKLKGDFPLWNKMNGAIDGQKRAGIIKLETFKVMTNNEPHYLIARSSLREIAKYPTIERYENFLHSLRIMIPMYGLENSLNMINKFDPIGTLNEMSEKGYFKKKLEI